MCMCHQRGFLVFMAPCPDGDIIDTTAEYCKRREGRCLLSKNTVPEQREGKAPRLDGTRLLNSG